MSIFNKPTLQVVSTIFLGALLSSVISAPAGAASSLSIDLGQSASLSLPLDPDVNSSETMTTTLNDDTERTIENANSPRVYTYEIDVPAGGELVSAKPSAPGSELSSEVLVKNAAGQIVGAYDSAWASDNEGSLVPSTYKISGSSIIQTIKFGSSTAFPVMTGLIYSAVGANAEGKKSGAGDGSMLFADAEFVGVPANYNYNPSLGSLNDYCTSSPDEFPAPFAGNANFRGPCARHDQCYGGGEISKFTCDNRLRSDMRINCRAEYGLFNPLRETCYITANVYWAAVVAAS